MTENIDYRRATTDPIKHPWSVIPQPQPAKSIAERMADAAEMDLALPYSLMCDAWDLLVRDLGPVIEMNADLTRTQFGAALTEALDAYDADQNAYWTDERIARARGETERIDGIVNYLDNEAPTAHDSLR